MKVFANGRSLESITSPELQDIVRNSLNIEIDLDYIVSTLNQFSKGLNEDLDIYKEISLFCSRPEIENKLLSELGTLTPFEIKRKSFKQSEMEAFSPLGTLLHITSSNSEGLSFLALVEGLLSCNTNIVKLSRRDSDICFKLVNKLLSYDKLGILKDKIIILQGVELSLDYLISLSDGVSCWGGDPALNSIKEQVPSSKRFIPWGHKISFSLIDLDYDPELKAKKLVEEILMNDQQACSAPQVCYILDAKFSDLKSFSKLLDNEFSKSSKLLKLDLDIQQRAELTNYNELLKLEALIENKDIIIGKNHNWRIYIEESSEFKGSPLNRTIWIKSIKRNSIVDVFFKYREYLQTVGVSLAEDKIDVLEGLVKAGVSRIRDLGKMQMSYSGEPHDGEYALRRFLKRISIDLDSFNSNFRFSEKIKKNQKIDKSLPVMGKQDFQALDIDRSKNHLFFRSGGSSGKPAISPFSYKSYHIQMTAAAEGLLASGLNPNVDRCANLFFGGGLYGGFISFFSILEIMEAIQYPLAAYEDKAFVAQTIVDHEINTLLGMPSYLIDLFKEHEDILKKGKVEKVFFGGEHFPETQRSWIKDNFGVKVIRSASYGSVDAGPLGFQCPHCIGSEHHLYESIQQLEVLEIESDQEVPPGSVGRLIFTSKARDSVSIDRYDIGDLGRIVDGECACGRKNLKFELLGRYGDIFRAGGTFFNYAMIQRILEEQFSYKDRIQILITNENSKDTVTIFLNRFDVDSDNFISNYQELNEALNIEKTLKFSIINSSTGDFRRSPSSGKILRVIDERRR